MYFLRPDRLGWRTWTPHDRALALLLWNDPDVMRLLGGPFGEDKVDARLAVEAHNLLTHRVQDWPVFALTDGAHVGVCGLKPYRPEQSVFELGFHLHRADWNGGYATEAARAVIAYARDTLGVGELFAGHHPENTASRRVLEKLGFRYAYDEFYAPTGLAHPGYTLTVAPQ